MNETMVAFFSLPRSFIDSNKNTPQLTTQAGDLYIKLVSFRTHFVQTLLFSHVFDWNARAIHDNEREPVAKRQRVRNQQNIRIKCTELYPIYDTTSKMMIIRCREITLCFTLSLSLSVSLYPI